MTDPDPDFVASILASMAPPDVPADFLARVNARIDETAGWFGLADFRLWTLRLAPAIAALALIAVLWPGASSSTTSTPSSTTSGPASPVPPASTTGVTPAASFSPASAIDWQQEVSADALLEAALHPAAGGVSAR
jgi:hypothetical protein